YLKPSEVELSNGDREYLWDMDHLELFSEDGDLIIEGAPVINIIRGDKFQITIDKKARGLNDDDAEFNAKNTEYSWVQTDSIIYLDRKFTIADEALVRNQKVYVNVQIPYDKNLDVSPYLDRYIDEY
ncbi:MAG: hypothetical protein N4A74_06330, partial [Carboxylicivirga sp.]|nr:hypothetical protein [Carboxylicivirga sp.]